MIFFLKNNKQTKNISVFFKTEQNKQNKKIIRLI